MEQYLKTSIWNQFGASIDFLEDTIKACPDNLWTASLWKTPDTYAEFSQFWYIAYHTLFWIDLYLTGTEDGFNPPPPFTLIEMEYDAPPPERVFTKDEVLTYLTDCRQKTKATIDALTNATAQRICEFGWGSCSFFELLIYNQRHVHGHASQLSMLLGQHLDTPIPDYVCQAREE